MILNDQLLEILKNTPNGKAYKIANKILELRLKKELQKEANNAIEDEEIKELLV